MSLRWIDGDLKWDLWMLMTVWGLISFEFLKDFCGFKNNKAICQRCKILHQWCKLFIKDAIFYIKDAKTRVIFKNKSDLFKKFQKQKQYLHIQHSKHSNTKPNEASISAKKEHKAFKYIQKLIKWPKCLLTKATHSHVSALEYTISFEI